ERERVAEVAQHEVHERLGRDVGIEDVGEAVDVGEQELGHLLKAEEEAPQVAGLVLAAVQHRQELVQLKPAARGARGYETREVGAVVGREDSVSEEVDDAYH